MLTRSVSLQVNTAYVMADENFVTSQKANICVSRMASKIQVAIEHIKLVDISLEIIEYGKDN